MNKKIIIIFLLLLHFFLPTTYGGDTLIDAGFMLKSDSFSPGSTELKNGDMKNTVTHILVNIIDLLIISFGVLSLFVMSIGAGYMIIYHGEEEFLSKGKTIFKAGLISLTIALLSGMIISFVNYLIYS